VTLTVEGATVRIGAAEVLRDLHFRPAPGRVTGVIGRNGAGKTTLLRLLSRTLAPGAGRVTLDGRDLYRQCSAREAARRIAVLPQDAAFAFDFTALEVVRMARYAHGGGDEDLALARAAMERTDTWPLRGRPVRALSGGERRRVLLARALAQATDVLLCDEPTAHLDVVHQVACLRIVRESGFTAVCVLHDLALAADYCDELVLLDGGGIAVAGDAERVLSSPALERAFGVPFDVERRNERWYVAPRL